MTGIPQNPSFATPTRCSRPACVTVSFRLAAIAHQYRNAAQVADWCKLIYSLKTMKLGIRGGQVFGSSDRNGAFPLDNPIRVPASLRALNKRPPRE